MRDWEGEQEGRFINPLSICLISACEYNIWIHRCRDGAAIFHAKFLENAVNISRLSNCNSSLFSVSVDFKSNDNLRFTQIIDVELVLELSFDFTHFIWFLCED